MHVCASCARKWVQVPREARNIQLAWNWSYR